MTTTTSSKLILEREGFRFVEKGIIELNGKPDYRLQMQDEYTKRWHDVYLFDNSMQCSIAMEDIEYAKWLTDQPCYMDPNDIEYWDQQSRRDLKSTGREQPLQSRRDFKSTGGVNYDPIVFLLFSRASGAGGE